MTGDAYLAIANGAVWTGRELHAPGTVYVSGDTIVDVVPGPTGDNGPSTDDKKGVTFDAEGALVVPGMINFHTHLYSSLAAGLVPPGPTDTFRGILENLWWRLDQVHDEESIYCSAVMGAIAHAEAGVTTIFDHHASMGLVDGSLDIVAQAVAEVGLRGVLCFETSDRSGQANASAHVRENLRFSSAHRTDPLLRGMMGLHAALTLSPATMELVARDRPRELPVHIHAGESVADLEAAVSDGSAGPVDRLHRYGLLDSSSFLAHAIHLSERDYALIRHIGPVVVNAAASNQNNGVGTMDGERIPFHVLGTDGMGSDMIAALRAFYLNQKLAGAARGNARQVIADYATDALTRFFPDCGMIAPGMRADLAVLDYTPITPITAESVAGHLIFGAQHGKSRLTLAGGRVVARDGRVTNVDRERHCARAREAAGKLHRRFYG